MKSMGEEAWRRMNDLDEWMNESFDTTHDETKNERRKSQRSLLATISTLYNQSQFNSIHCTINRCAPNMPKSNFILRLHWSYRCNRNDLISNVDYQLKFYHSNWIEYTKQYGTDVTTPNHVLSSELNVIPPYLQLPSDPLIIINHP